MLNPPMKSLAQLIMPMSSLTRRSLFFLFTFVGSVSLLKAQALSKRNTDGSTACALIANDGATLCNVARWFMREYQFVTDGYRFFSALNRLCDSENSWFNCGPSQKYILRQLKAVDFSLTGKATSKHLSQERASYTTKDSNGNPIRADDMDVALLMLYGHVLYAGKSYANAVSKSIRSHTVLQNKYALC